MFHRSFAALTLVLALLVTTTTQAAAGTVSGNVQCSTGNSLSVKQLPKQGRETLDLIAAGGPFPHARDGVTFGNRERLLPQAKRGYYREYTVRTPGVRTRGARRIVCGGSIKQDITQCYYSADHYASFSCITP